MKKITPTGYYVRIEPANGRIFSSTLDDDKSTCEEMIEQIKRHVDGVRYAEVVTESEATCSFCGYRWTADKNEENGCCEEDEKEFKNSTPAQEGRSENS